MAALVYVLAKTRAGRREIKAPLRELGERLKRSWPQGRQQVRTGPPWRPKRLSLGAPIPVVGLIL
jgi:hypothetical protein